MLDVFFITMGEEGSEDNWKRLLEFAPNAKRIDNVRGIYHVHKACADLSLTDNFWVVDADAWIVDGFRFQWEPDPSVQHWGVPENECVVIWPSLNPVNDLSYGYGAVKIFPRKPFIENKSWSVDMTSSIVKVVVSKNDRSCETRFNVTPESAWIGAFRECAKLSSLTIIKTRINKSKEEEKEEFKKLNEHVKSQDLWDNKQKENFRKVKTALIRNRFKETEMYNYSDEIETNSHRRFVWCTEGWDRLNGKYSILGAQAGSKFGLANSDDIEKMNLINDWNWLKKEFKNVNV